MRQILRVSTGTAYKDIKPQLNVSNETKSTAVSAPENIRAIFINRCSKCHEQMQSNPEQL